MNVTNLKKLSIALKILEIIVLLVGTGFMGHFLKEYHDYLIKDDPRSRFDLYDVGVLGRFEFYLFATCVGVVIAIFGLVLSLTDVFKKNSGALAMAAVNALWTLQLVVSTALLAKVLSTYQGKQFYDDSNDHHDTKSQCDLLDSNEDFTCSQIIVGVICGFFGAALYLVDTLNAFLASKFSLGYAEC